MKVIRIAGGAGASCLATIDEQTGDAHVLRAQTWAELHEDQSLAGAVVPAAKVRALPLLTPSKIVAMACAFMPDPTQQFQPGVDKDPFFFLKPPSAMIGDGDLISVPPMAAGSVFESELAAVIGRRCKAVSVNEALSYVVGYTICNDMSAPAVMQTDGQWARGKGFDTFCPIGPVVETELPDPEDALITASLTRDGEQRELVRQSTATQIWSVAQCISYCSQYMTLEPGDVISFGCPPGPIPVEDGDVVTVTIEGIGTLTNPVRQL